MVVAEPLALRAKRHDECPCLLKPGEDPGRVAAAREGVGQWPAHPVQYRCPKEEAAHLIGLALQNLGEKVFGDAALMPSEPRSEAFGIQIPGHRERGESDASSPSFGRFDQASQSAV